MSIFNKYKKHTVFLFFFFINVTYSADLDQPEIGGLVDVILKIFYYLMGLAGVVFAAMVAYSAWKFAASLGNPKGVEGAKQSLTYSLLGFGVVVCAFVLFRIIVNFLDIGELYSLKGIITRIINVITGDLLKLATKKGTNP